MGNRACHQLSKRHRVTLWARDAEQIAAMSASRRNQRYLPEIPLPQELHLSADLNAALANAN